MAQVLRFITPAMQKRESILAELRLLASACGMTWEQVTAFACGEGKTWDDRPTDFLYGPLNILRASVAEQQEKVAQAAASAVPTGRKAKVIPFGGVAGKQEAAQAAAPAVEQPLVDKEGAHRRAMIIKVQIRLKELYAKLPGFDEDVYRFIMREHWGVDSSTKLSNGQLHELLLHLQMLEFEDSKSKRRGKSKVKRGKQKITRPLAGHDAPALLYSDPSGLGRTYLMEKISALLSEKGAAEGRYITWNYALGILKRQSGGVVDDWEKAMPENLRAVIAALYRDAKRKGRRTE